MSANQKRVGPRLLFHQLAHRWQAPQREAQFRQAQEQWLPSALLAPM
jgi:hypothetical protein